MERRLITVQGVVQGVGFRPYVHRLAAANGLRGFVRNEQHGVAIDVEGDRTSVDAFCGSLILEAPPLATIAGVRIERAPPRSYSKFRIAPSDAADASPGAASVPADVATCGRCLAELRDPANRRYRHPFISCTDCGPRLTIVRDTPYDRERTAMAPFTMCAACRTEYDNPDDRRFHAETICCWDCGPEVQAVSRDASVLALRGCHAIAAAVETLRNGGIVAVKALGGYHLACDATNASAVERLRALKCRDAKPFAVMVRDVAGADALCSTSVAERAVLEACERPIVLVPRRDAANLAASVAPGQLTLGVMLPATPVHHLLLDGVARPLVMTSGNRRDEPVAIDEGTALSALGAVADLFLVHDRAIITRCDDSVVLVSAGEVRTVRRARGYAPRSIPIARAATRPILAVGGHLKNTVCVVDGARATMSAHVGDLDTIAARDGWRHAVDCLLRATRTRPAAIAHDLHPDYASTGFALSMASELGIETRIAVQHHHAHVASCLAEHGVREPVIGVAFDGAGLGSDGAIWGGEFLLVHGASFTRCGHLSYVPLPGGDAAARRPWRSAAAHLTAARGAASAPPPGVDAAEWNLVTQLLARPERLPQSSSVGRLFDAVASLLDVAHISRFEGEAAMRLESAATGRAPRRYDVTLLDGAPWTVDVAALIRAIDDDCRHGRSTAESAGAFHRALSDVIVLGCKRVRESAAIATVALSGGVFVNRLLLALATQELTAAGFRVLLHAQVPCNDGGVSLGQACVAARAMEDEQCA